MHWLVKADAHMGLRCEVVDLIRVDTAEQGHQPGAVSEVCIVQEQARARLVWVNVEVIDPRRVKRRSSTNEPVNLVSLAQ